MLLRDRLDKRRVSCPPLDQGFALTNRGIDLPCHIGAKYTERGWVMRPVHPHSRSNSPSVACHVGLSHQSLQRHFGHVFVLLLLTSCEERVRRVRLSPHIKCGFNLPPHARTDSIIRKLFRYGVGAGVFAWCAVLTSNAVRLLIFSFSLGSMSLLIAVSLCEPVISPSIADLIAVTPIATARMVDVNICHLYTKCVFLHT